MPLTMIVSTERESNRISRKLEYPPFVASLTEKMISAITPISRTLNISRNSRSW